MPVDAQRILSGAPDQLTTGAILSAPMATAVPDDEDVYAGDFSGFASSGYVSEDGLALSLSKSFETIKDWSGAIVKRILSEFDGTIKYTHLELSEFSLKDTFGDANVAVTAATESHGTQFKVSIGAVDLPTKRYAFKMKDGLAKVVIVVPAGTPTEVDEIPFKKTDAIKLGITLGCQPDAAGNVLYLYLDDGVVAVAGP